MERKKWTLRIVGIIVICVAILAVIYILLSGTITEAEEDQGAFITDYDLPIKILVLAVIIVIVFLLIRKGGEEIQN